MDARRDQVYTGIFDVREKEPVPLLYPCAISIDRFIEKACALSEQTGQRLLLMGDGVPVFLTPLVQKLTCPYHFVPAPNNRQRAASVGALGELMLKEGRGISAAECAPAYLRPSQAERVRKEKQEEQKKQLFGVQIRPLEEKDLEEYQSILGMVETAKNRSVDVLDYLMSHIHIEEVSVE